MKSLERFSFRLQISSLEKYFYQRTRYSVRSFTTEGLTTLSKMYSSFVCGWRGRRFLSLCWGTETLSILTVSLTLSFSTVMVFCVATIITDGLDFFGLNLFDGLLSFRGKSSRESTKPYLS